METVSKADIYYSRWKNLPWKKFFSRKTYLQSQIHYSRKLHNFTSLYRIQNKLLRSKACHYIAVQKVNSVYARKYGVCMTYKKRFKLIKLLREKSGDIFYFSGSLNKNFMKDYVQNIESSIREFLWRLAIEPLYIDGNSEFNMTLSKQVINTITFRKISKINEVHSSPLVCLNWRKLLFHTHYKVLLRKIRCPIKHKIAFYKTLKLSFFEISREGFKIRHLKNPLIYFLFCECLTDLEEFVPLGTSFIYKDYLFYEINEVFRPLDILTKFNRFFCFNSSFLLLKKMVWVVPQNKIAIHRSGENCSLVFCV